ncbi:GDSL-type esterase/lipase family protein [Promicromonospora panici]|uniref:GDSL-type esterase/lipase family protein n=1 Tax=Promicromonospora panici TaxID=2219658 RepID=UPI0013ECA6D3|nr:GDSL-type esterase/lipase family protein [Promicromonospora panici]
MSQRRRWLAGLAGTAIGVSGIVSGTPIPTSAATGEEPVHAPVSRLATGTYERDEALEVDGKPFFFNGVQLRVDKNGAVFGPEYAYNSEKTRSLYKSASDLGFTTINVQVPWLFVQPDESVPASDAAYVVKGSPGETFSGGNIRTAFDSADEANQSLALLKFTIPSDYDYELTASKVRIYVDNEGNPQGDGADLFRSHDLKVYGLADDWDDSDVTWDSLGVTDYDGQNLAIDGVEQTPLDVTPSWDRIKKANYYDLDVTDFVKAQYEGDGDRTVSVLLQSATPLDAESEVPISIDGLAGTYPPQLVLSSADERNFDWSYLDEAMRNASNNNLKFEIMWFGGDTTSNSMDNRIPYYVFQSVAKTMSTPSCASEPVFRAEMTELKKARLNACDPNHPAGAPLFKKRTAQTSQMYGVYDYLLDKTDPKLMELEAAALAKVMDHVAEWEANENNGKHTTVGVQVSNESMTLSMEGSGSINGTSIDVSQSDMALEAWKDFKGFTTESTANNGADTFKEFNRHVLWNYYNELSKVVKESDYSVWTRANDALRGYSAVEYNQKVQETGGTSYLDFIGVDPYSASRANQYAFGHSKVWNGVDYSYGHNLPMIMEIGAEDGQYAVPYGLLSTLSGGGYYNIYELCGADEHGVFNSPATKYGVGDCTYDGPFFDASGSRDTSAANRLKIDYLTGVNTMLKKIGHDVATKRPNGLSGKKLVYMNERQGAGSGRDVTAQLRSMDVTFRSHPLTIGTWSAETAGIAIERSATQFAFANAGAQATTFTLSDMAGEIASAQVGSYDDPSNDVTDNEWTRESDATVTTSGTDAVVTVPAFGVVRVVTRGPVPPATKLIDEDFGTAAAAPAFGFSRDARVSDGELKLNNNLGNETTAVKLFGPEVSGQSAVDLTFDWTYRGDRNSKGGIEFRDPYGRLVFAVMGSTKTTGDNQLRYSTSGTDADSSHAKFGVEPTWTARPITVGKTYTVRFQADFANKTISYQILDGTNVLVENANKPMTATGLDRMVATSAYKENSNAQSVDNVLLTVAGDAPSPMLAGKTVYAFGDSIVAGHRYPTGSFIDFVARQEGLTLVKKAVNGATVLPSSNTIVNQLASAPAGQPHYIVFDGGTNDAYPATLDKLGAISDGFDSELDVSTFAGAFENLIARMKEKYPEADIVYTAVHRLGARDSETQEALREIELAACAKWGVTVADVYSTKLDTTDVTKRVKYSFDSLQASGLPGTADTTGSWEVDGVLRPTGTHPNFPAIEEFYAPVVANTLRDTQD